MQLEQGVFLSHLIFLCWQRTHASILGARPVVEEADDAAAAAPGGVGSLAEDIFGDEVPRCRTGALRDCAGSWEVFLAKRRDEVSRGAKPSECGWLFPARWEKTAMTKARVGRAAGRKKQLNSDTQDKRKGHGEKHRFSTVRATGKKKFGPPQNVKSRKCLCRG